MKNVRTKLLLGTIISSIIAVFYIEISHYFPVTIKITLLASATLAAYLLLVNTKTYQVYYKSGWFEYFIGILSTYPLTTSTYSLILNEENRHYNKVTLIIACIVLLSGLILLYLGGKNRDLDREAEYFKDYKLRQAPGSNTKSDYYDIKTNSSNELSRILKIADDNISDVTVLSLIGSQGGGKSVYLNSIIGHLRKDQFLYTYISGVESNRDSDFSRLFGNRWGKTISARYPSIKGKLNIDMLLGISREANFGWLGLICYWCFNAFPINITNTLKKFLNNVTGEDLGSECLRVFDGVKEFKEKYWVIVIDDIDRSRIQEVLRIIETVERFKHLAQNTNLPIKVIFILVCDIDKLKINIQNNPNYDGSLIADFMEARTADYIFTAPLRSRKSIYNNHIKSRLTESPICKEFIRKNPSIWDYGKVNFLDYVKKPEYLIEKDILDMCSSLLSRDTPRIIDRTFAQAEVLGQTYLNSTRGIMKDITVRYSYPDLLLFSYFIVKFPHLQRWLIDKLKEIEEPNFKAIGEEDYNLTETEFIKALNIVGGDKYKIELWQIMCTLFPYLLNSKLLENYKSSWNYAERLTNPDGLTLFLKGSGGDPTEAEYDYTRSDIYRNMEKNEESQILIELCKLNPGELLDYSTYLRRIEAKSNMYLAVAKTILKYFVEKKFMVRIFTIDDFYWENSQQKNAAYELLFTTSQVLKSGGTDQKNQAIRIIEEFIKSDKVPFTPKFILLKALYERDNTDTHLQLNSIYLKNKAKIDELSKNVLADFERKFIKKEGNIYKEEQPIYLLYQYWNGKMESASTIQKIAKRNITEAGLKHFFSRLPDFDNQDILYELDNEKKLQYIQDALDDSNFHRSDTKSIRLYFDLECLIKAVSKNRELMKDRNIRSKVEVYTKYLGDKSIKKILEKKLALYEPNPNNRLEGTFTQLVDTNTQTA